MEQNRLKSNQDHLMEKKIERMARGIQHCQKCERSRTRSHAVAGEGDPDSGMLLVGEATSDGC